MKISRSHSGVSSSLWLALFVLAGLVFGSFLGRIFHVWLQDEDFTFGMLIPPLVAYLLCTRRDKISQGENPTWWPGLLLTLTGCGLQILASKTGTFLESGLALVLVILGCFGYLCGKRKMVAVAGPVALLMLMIPLPSYAVGELSWYLQSASSTASGTILRLLGVPVYQDGNLLRLPNYVLEVKQACSGSRSIFALVALASAIGLGMGSKYWIRALLVLVAPLLALGANIIRIVGTGIIAREWGSLAANESMHEAWGIAVFLIAVSGLLGMQNLLRRA